MADAVADVIRDAESINVIGLLGGWGSGKSTVVHYIAKRLEERPGKVATRLFTYDAWLHQNDPPRRAFLEALIGNLTSQKLIKKEDWEPRLADLTGRAEKTETETTRRLSDTGKWIFLSLALVPLGLGFLDFDLVDKAFGPDSTTLGRVMFWLSLTLTMAPLIVIALFYVLWRPWKTSFASHGWWRFPFSVLFWLEHDETHKDESILALLTNQSVERSENKTKISPEPTAIEFRAVFRDVLKALQAHKKRLVIVIDNLDRLAEADAMQLWATIRSLFLGGEAAAIQAEPGLPPPAIILPIDESAIARMFSIAHADEKDELAAAFIDKTFDIVFHVNEPVMSDWRAYLGEKLREAFGALATQEQVYWATKIVEEKFAQETKGAKTKITPRKLIKLVNSVAALLVQRSDEAIDFVAMVFYAAHRTAISSGVREFLGRDRPRMDAAVANWRRQVVALHFGVVPEKAFQALLHEPLRLAVVANNQTEFDELIQGPGAWAVMEEIVDNPPPEADGAAPEANFVANAALLITAAPPTDDDIPTRRALARLGKRWIEATDIGPIRPDLSDVIKSLSGSLATDLIAPFLSASAQKVGAAMTKSKADEATLASFRDSVAALKALAVANKIKMPGVPLAIGTDVLFALLGELPPDHWPHIRSDKSAGEIIAALNSSLSDESSSSSVPRAVLALSSSATIQLKDKGTLDWDSLVNTASGIAQGQSLEHHATAAALDVLGILHSINQAAKDAVAHNFDQGRLGALLNEADQQKDPDRLADIAALMLLKGADFPGPNGKGWDQILRDYDGFAKKVDAALGWYRPTQRTTFALKAKKTRPSFLLVIKELAKLDVTENSSDNISTSYLLTNLASLSDDIGDDLLNRCIEDVSTRQAFWSALDEIENGPAFDNAIERLGEVEEFDHNRLTGVVRARLENADQAKWSGAITEGAPPYELAQIFQSDLEQKELAGDSLKLALQESRPLLLKSQGAVRERWFSLVTLLSKSARATMLRNLRDSLQAGNEVTELENLIAIGGTMLMTEGKFADDPDKTARHVILPLVSHEEGRAVLKEQDGFFKSIASKSERETKAAIIEALDAVTDSDDEQGRGITELKAALGVG